MAGIKSIDKLRSWASYMLEDSIDLQRDVHHLANEIEREVAERYMPKPQRTIEDVLEDFGIECDEQYPIRPRTELIAEYANEIRGLL